MRLVEDIPEADRTGESCGAYQRTREMLVNHIHIILTIKPTAQESPAAHIEDERDVSKPYNIKGFLSY